MIIIQILAGIILVPLTALVIILTNIYIRHWIYLLAMLAFALIYSALCGLAFNNYSTFAWCLTGLSIYYTIRMFYLASKLRKKNNNPRLPWVRGDIRDRKSSLNIAFMFPLAFFKIVKLIPGLRSRKTPLGMTLPALVDIVIERSVGSTIEVTNHDAHVYLEIR